MKNNNLECVKCKDYYSLIKRNNINECEYIPTLYDANFMMNYENHFYYINKGEVTIDDFYFFTEQDYFYNRFMNYYPCQEAENLGTELNPLYSCKKCYELLHEKFYPVRITEENSKVSFCLEPHEYEELKNVLKQQ